MVQAKQIEDENLCSKYTENELLKTQKSCMNGQCFLIILSFLVVILISLAVWLE